MKRYWSIWPALGILVAAAVAHGERTDRWGTSADLLASAEQLQKLPITLGDWDSVATELTPAQFAATNVAGAIGRRFTHRYDRTEVNVLILCGRPGPVAVHPPEVCYGANGFTMGTVQQDALEEGHTMWRADFTKPGGLSDTLRVRWAWSDGQSWQASRSPRTDYARSRVLYKFYAVKNVSSSDINSDYKPEIDLINRIIATLKLGSAFPIS
jgi:hypothetical protein